MRAAAECEHGNTSGEETRELKLGPRNGRVPTANTDGQTEDFFESSSARHEAGDDARGARDEREDAKDGQGEVRSVGEREDRDGEPERAPAIRARRLLHQRRRLVARATYHRPSVFLNRPPEPDGVGIVQRINNLVAEGCRVFDTDTPAKLGKYIGKLRKLIRTLAMRLLPHCTHYTHTQEISLTHSVRLSTEEPPRLSPRC